MSEKQQDPAKNWSPETQAVLGGYFPGNGDPRVLPLIQSTSFRFTSAQHVADLFDLKETGHMYSRISNPTVEALEKKAASLEGGIGAVAVSSGQSAAALIVLNLCSAGDHILVSKNLYGGTITLFTHQLKRWGIEADFFDPDASGEEIRGMMKATTKLVFAEMLSNPGVKVLDVEKIAAAAHDAGLPLAVDNTFPTPYLCRPGDWGADIVMHSSTKYMDGHATSVGGLIVDTGNYDWGNGRFPEFMEPDEAYHGVVYSEQFGAQAFLARVRTQLVRDLGTAMSPFNAYMTFVGAETLHLRMPRHSSNALAAARFLEKDSRVSWVNYPGLESSPEKTRAQKYLSKGCSGVLTFGIAGGREAGIRFMDSVKVATLMVHVGDIRTGVLHPASMTHRQLSEAELEAAGIKPEMIRVTVGIEGIDDILADIDQALG